MRTAAELQHQGWEALVEKLGLADAVRYRVLFQPGTGDYAEERRKLFGQMAMDNWIAELQQWEQQHPSDESS